MPKKSKKAERHTTQQAGLSYNLVPFGGPGGEKVDGAARNASELEKRKKAKVGKKKSSNPGESDGKKEERARAEAPARESKLGKNLPQIAAGNEIKGESAAASLHCSKKNTKKENMNTKQEVEMPIKPDENMQEEPGDLISAKGVVVRTTPAGDEKKEKKKRKSL
ncbi:unnamed protein product, partial [Amoebophrya sp. A120]|eukprot:GSA120T00000946001.1